MYDDTHSAGDHEPHDFSDTAPILADDGHGKNHKNNNNHSPNDNQRNSNRPGNGSGAHYPHNNATFGTATGASSGAVAQPGCRDVPFLVLYLSACLALFATAFIHAKRPIVNPDLDFSNVNPARSKHSGGSSSSSNNGRDGPSVGVGSGVAFFGWAVAAAVPFAAVAALLSLRLMRTHARRFIHAAVVAFNALLWASAVAQLLSGNVPGGVVCAIFAALHLGWFLSVRALVPFTAHLLSWSARAVAHFSPSLLVAPLVAAVLQASAFGAVSAAFLSVARTIPREDTGALFALLGFSVFVALWTFGVLQNVVHVTVSGAVGTYYYHGLEAPAGTPGRSLRRAVTTSLGSICFGSLLVAVVQTLRYAAQYARRHARNNGGAFAALCLGCVLSLLEGLLRWFNSYAFVIVALRGLPYLRAASEAYDLVSAQGISMLINDDLTGTVVLMASLACSVAAGAVAAVAALITDREWAPVAIAVAVVVFIILTVLFNPILSAMKTFYVCYAESPADLHDREAELSQKIQERRQDRYEEQHPHDQEAGI